MKNIFQKAGLGFFCLLIVSGLTACDLTYLSGPLSDVLGKKISGLTVKAEKVSAGVRPLYLEAKGLVLSYKKGDDSLEIRVPECRLLFDWSLTWESLPWPKIHLTRISVNRPKLSLVIPYPKKGGDWTQILAKVPRFDTLEVQELKGEAAYGKNLIRFNQGTNARISFNPEEGGRISLEIQGMEGRTALKGLSFQANGQGGLELIDFPKQPKFRGNLRLFQGGLTGKEGSLKGVSGEFDFLWEKEKRRFAAKPLRVREIAWKGKEGTLQVKGEWSLSGEIKGRGGGKPQWEWNGVEGKWKLTPFFFEQGKKKIQGHLRGEGRMEGALKAPSLVARIFLQRTDITLPPVDTLGLEAEIQVRGKVPNLFLSVTRAQAVQTDWWVASRPLTLIRPETRFSVEIQGKLRTIHLKDIQLKSANWGTLYGNLFFDPKKDPVPEGEGRAEQFPLPRFLTHFLPKAAEPFSEEVPCRGTFRWKRKGKGAPLAFKISLEPPLFSFQVPRTDWEGEGIGVFIETEGEWFIEDRKVRLNLSQDLWRGSFSRSPWFFPFDEERLKSRFQGMIDGRKETASVKGVLNIRYPPLGEVHLTVDWPFHTIPPVVSGTVEVKGLPLEKGFPLLVGKPLSYRHPSLGKFFLQGLLDGRVVLSKDEEGFSLTGRLESRGMEMRFKDPPLYFGVADLELPIRFHTSPDKRNRARGEEIGWLNLREIDTPWFVVPAFSVPFTLNEQGYQFTEALKVPLWGGEAVLSSFKIIDPLQGMRMEGDLSLNQLDLQEMFQKKEVVGSLSGSLGPIRLDKEKAEIGGSWKASVFEGTVKGNHFWIEKPFGSERKIGGEMEFSGLNLEILTRLFSFGKITGFLEGRVKDLVLKGKMPERFRLWARTQDRPGVAKRINVTAIENIGLLGTGWGEMDTLRKGINRFITEYAYREIGFSCSLRDDLFTLRGTIIEDGVEYLVRKPAFWGIDVINKNPQNEILFSDIMERLKRIGNKSREGIRYEME